MNLSLAGGGGAEVSNYLKVDGMTTQHTPGPWAWRSDAVAGIIVYMPDGIADPTIAEVCGPDLDGLAYEANARLIAAAPALLEAAEAALHWYEPGCGFCKRGVLGPHMTGCPGPMLGAAIAQATEVIEGP